MNQKLYIQEPYRILFIIGLLHLARGAFVWILYALNFIDYPGLVHARSMAEGFLLCFALGFLMTAIPRFSKTQPSHLLETIIAVSLGVFSGFYDLAAFLALIFLVLFGVRRNVFSRSVKKPPFFLFIQGGLILGIAGISMKLIKEDLFPFYKLWLYEGMLYLWLCGIGSRILVMLLDSNARPLTLKQNNWIFYLLMSTFLLQPFIPQALFIFELLRSLALSYLCLKVWKVHVLPRRKGTLAWSVWMGISFFCLGQWIKALFPEYGIHALHLIFIGAFGLLALMVSVRVSIAHSGEDLSQEKHSPKIVGVAGLLLLAAITRFTAIMMPQHYIHHLAYAAGTLLAAIFLWSSIVMPKLFQGKDEV